MKVMKYVPQEAKDKIMVKPKLDMGIGIKGRDEIAQYGASTTDPKQFKGNIDLQRFVHAHFRTKFNKNVETSASLKMEKYNKNIILDEYNILLPEDQI
jgi:hypothetical protein